MNTRPIDEPIKIVPIDMSEVCEYFPHEFTRQSFPHFLIRKRKCPIISFCSQFFWFTTPSRMPSAQNSAGHKVDTPMAYPACKSNCTFLSFREKESHRAPTHSENLLVVTHAGFGLLENVSNHAEICSFVNFLPRLQVYIPAGIVTGKQIGRAHV